MPKISIIVPVFNTSAFIEECFNSILSQTFTDWELIIIDDGSTDNSAEIALKFVDIDKRISYYYKKNSGVSASRNYGLKYASGQYVIFVDSDDICHPEMLELLLRGMDKNTALSVCLYTRFSKSPFIFPDTYTTSLEVCSNIATIYNTLNRVNMLHAPVAKLYLKETLDQYKIRFDEHMSLGEDLYFNLDYLDHVSCATIIPIVLYYYRDTENSLSKNIRNDYATIQLSILDRKIDFIKRNEINFDFKPYASGIVGDILRNILKSKSSVKEKFSQLKHLHNHRIMNDIKLDKLKITNILALIIKHLPLNT